MAHFAMDTQALASEHVARSIPSLPLVEIRLPDKFLAPQRAGKAIGTIQDSDKVTIFPQIPNVVALHWTISTAVQQTQAQERPFNMNGFA